eukprot:3019936-Pyramimonas_sp.AAC.1
MPVDHRLRLGPEAQRRVDGGWPITKTTNTRAARTLLHHQRAVEVPADPRPKSSGHMPHSRSTA